jgi:hypothetical protein
MLGLCWEEVCSERLLQVDAMHTMTWQQRIVAVARDMLQAKECSTMAAYVPIMQKQLAWSWHLQHTRQQQQQQQHQGAAGQQQGQEGAAGVGAATVQSLLVNVRVFLSFIAAAERPGAAMRERFARVLNGSIDDASSSSSTTGELASVQAVRQLVQGVPEEGCLMQGRFSLGNWKKHLNACTYLQQQQQHIMLGKTRGGSERRTAYLGLRTARFCRAGT